ncbi:MAG: ABC transporter permease, partial [Bifidobacteriaceae bacterium]|nr:ABC transporter permease [Bifidobacteriaceae bacterium]
MTWVTQAVRWLVSAQNWAGANGIAHRLAQHVVLTLVIVAVAAVIALPLGVWVGHRRRGRATVAAVAGAGRAIPTLGLLTLL